MTLHGQLNTARCQKPDTSLMSTMVLHQNVAILRLRTQEVFTTTTFFFQKVDHIKINKGISEKKWTNHCCVDSLGVKCSLSQAPRPLLNIKKKKQLKQILTRPPNIYPGLKTDTKWSTSLRSNLWTPGQ